MTSYIDVQIVVYYNVYQVSGILFRSVMADWLS